jgi:hypothetical protein
LFQQPTYFRSVAVRQQALDYQIAITLRVKLLEVVLLKEWSGGLGNGRHATIIQPMPTALKKYAFHRIQRKMSSFCKTICWDIIYAALPRAWQSSRAYPAEVT